MAIIFSSTEEAPEILRQYLEGSWLAQVNRSIFAHHGLDTFEVQDAVLQAQLDVFLGVVSLEKFPHALSVSLQKSKEEIASLAAEIGTRVFQPAQEYVGPAQTYALRWDEKTAQAGYDLIGEPLALPSYTRDEMIRMLMDMRPKSVVHPKAVANYEKLVSEMVYRGRGNFDEQQYLTGLTQPMEQDGVQMKPDEAAALLLQMKQILAASNTAKAVGPVTDSREAAKQSAKQQKEAEKDVAAATRSMRDMLGTTAAPAPDSEFIAAIMARVRALGADLATDAMQKIIDARVKDIRDTRATMDMLMKASAVGGMGLDADRAMAVVMVVEEEIHNALQMKKKEVASTSAPMAASQSVAAEAAPAPALVDDLYIKTLGSARMKELGASHADNLRTSGIPIAAAATAQSSSPASPAPTAPLAPRPPVARMNVETPKPKMEDVRKVSSVMGPVQEIENVRLVDFRRSAQSAEVRVEKIVSAINRIGEESYPDKIEAIFAWRRSEPYQMYEQLLVEALDNHKPLVVVIQEHVRDRKPTLDREEVAALINGGRTLEEW